MENLVIQEQMNGGRASVHAAEFMGQEAVIKYGTEEGLRREFEVLHAASDVPGIPKLYDVRKEEAGSSEYALISERLPGTGLDKHINLDSNWNSTPLPPQEAVKITVKLARIFRGLNKAGYFYRDLNFSHVLVDQSSDEPSVGLIDLEACVPKDGQGKARVDSLTGTWETMAPEEFQVGDEMSEASQTYTLGAVLLQLVAGKTPYHVEGGIPGVDSRSIAAYQHRKGAAFLPFEGTPLGDVLQRSLDPDPNARYASVQAFMTDLKALEV